MGVGLFFFFFGLTGVNPRVRPTTASMVHKATGMPIWNALDFKKATNLSAAPIADRMPLLTAAVVAVSASICTWAPSSPVIVLERLLRMPLLLVPRDLLTFLRNLPKK